MSNAWAAPLSSVSPGTPSHVAIEGLSILSILGTVTSMLPTLAVMLAIVWYCLEIWESHTFARLRERLHWEEKAAARRVKAEAAVAAQTVLVEAAEAVKQAVETQLPKE